MNDYKLVRYKLNIYGQVQGVGFRPTVYKYAKKYNLAGWVANNPEGVVIEIEGTKTNIDNFISKIKSYAPVLSHITEIKVNIIDPIGEKEFSIKPSIIDESRSALIPPDICICENCINELFDKNNRRYLYPFINCVNCGPRFTIIKDVPYDRARTTMSGFKMCIKCESEYNNPLNRRFHAEPNACPECGPQIELIGNPKFIVKKHGSEKSVKGKKAIDETIRLLREGKIIAIKGIGGFHLACDATNNNAVLTLRSRKYREDKPFAMMAKDIEIIRQYCEVSSEEEKLLLSEARPIVLLKRLSSKIEPNISEFVAPNNGYFGFMLPYTPLHYLLFSQQTDTRSPLILVMTSGNVSDEPICYTNESAYDRLSNIADYFLVHNRDIYIRCDDSVVRCFLLSSKQTQEYRTIFVRRARGYTPLPIILKYNLEHHVLSCGAELKNTFCLAKDKYVFISHHIGDLENIETLTAFEQGIEHYKKLFDIKPEIVVYDMHPEYLSTKYAIELLRKNVNLIGIPVQHHHAHVASCMADNNLENEYVIGVAFDGLGYGDDGNFWGAEFFINNYKEYKRIAHLEYVPLPGGNIAVKEPWRMGCIYLWKTFGDDFLNLNIEFVKSINLKKWEIIKKMVSNNINSPLISSTGRLFDAVGAILNIRYINNYEGETAIELEQYTHNLNFNDFNYIHYEFDIKEELEVYIIDTSKIIKGIVEDITKNVHKSIVSMKFHLTVVSIIHELCSIIRTKTKLNNVVLSGGVFQNIFILKKVYEILQNSGFNVYFHKKLPTNDAGISFGQTVITYFKEKKNG